MRDVDRFRPDINGLRAWAVVAVIGFHFGIPGFGGGFVGVDVFFVISGFLMTRIISGGLERTDGDRRFSILRFYLARAARIVPALAMLCGVLLVLGSLFLPPKELAMLGRHVLASIGFYSNLTYWKEAGYFDVASSDKWLLHTWSLSVEWQFYLLLPVAFVAAGMCGARRRSLALLSLTGLAVSLALSVAFTPTKASSAFFLLPTRAWEMLAGGLIHLLPRRVGWRSRERTLLEVAGFALIVVSILVFSPLMTWPGWRATVPVAGTVLVLLANRPASLWTGARVTQWIGSNSYSLYLWHWPVVVGLAYFDMQGEPLAVATGLISTFVLGNVSYRTAEQWSRRRLERLATPRRALLLASAVLVVAASTWLLATRTPRIVPTAEASDGRVMPLSSNGWCFRNVEVYGDVPLDDRETPCKLGAKSSPVAGLLSGDSFAGQYEPFWDDVGRAAGVRIDSVTTNWCFPTVVDEYLGLPDSRAWEQCKIDRRYVARHLQQYDFVVFSGLWRFVFLRGKQQGLFDAIDQAASRVPLVIVMPSPTDFGVNVLAQYERRKAVGLSFDVRHFVKTSDDGARAANAALAAYVSRYPNVVFIERHALFSVDGSPSNVTADNVPYSLDGAHLSVYGSKAAAANFLRSPTYAGLRRKFEAMDRSKSGAPSNERGAAKAPAGPIPSEPAS